MAGKVIKLGTRRLLAQGIVDRWVQRAQQVADIEAGFVTEKWMVELLPKYTRERDRDALLLVELGVPALPAPVPAERTKADPHGLKARARLRNAVMGCMRTMS